MIKIKPAENDIQNYVKTLLRESDKQFQLMYGRNVKILDKPDMRQRLISQLRNYNVTPDQLKLSPKTFKEFYRGFSRGMGLAHYIYTTGGKVPLQEFVSRHLESMFSLSPESLLTDTKFRSYRKYFFKTIPSIIDEEKFRRINEFLTSINKKEFYALGQQMIQLNMRLGKLHREGTAITISVIDHHKDIYDLACSCVEKYLKILYGINLAYDGNPYKFNKIKNTPIYEIKSRLQKSNHSYQLLLKPFITIIWNANKHTGTVMNLTNKRIEFIANEGVKWKTYTSFIQLTKELCAVTFLLSRYVFAILLKMIRQLTKRYAA